MHVWREWGGAETVITDATAAGYNILVNVGYRDDSWYWELIEMFRKLVFTSLIMFLATGTSMQQAVAMAFAFASLFSHLFIQAYKDRSDSLIQTVSMTCIFLTLWLGLLNKAGVLQEFEDAGWSIGCAPAWPYP